MEKAKVGDIVMVHYKGTLDDGTVFDTTFNDEPLVFKIGSGDILPAFENALIGMKPFEKKKFKVPCKEAYGEYQKELLQTIPLSSIPKDIELKVGESLLIGENEEDAIEFVVTKIDEESVTLDPNSSLAGKNLNFEIEVLAVKKDI